MANEVNRSRKAARVLFFGLLGLFGLCIGALALFAGINATLPKTSVDPEKLSEEQAALMEEALHLKAVLGNQVWPGFGEASIPVMTWNEKYAFLCAHPQPTSQWEALVGVQVAGQPCYRVKWEDGQNFTERIGDYWTGSLATREWSLIALRQPFTDLLPGPVQAVAPVFLLVNEMMRLNRYLGAELHEAFHGFQASTMHSRFDDAELAYLAGDRYWKQDPQMNEAWEAEIEALYNAVYAKSDAEGRSDALQFLQLRRDRRQHSLADPELVRYEQRFEWLEGLAKYTELTMLQAANEAEDYHSVPALLEKTSFRDYKRSEQLVHQEMSQMKRQATVEGDTRFYYTGFAQAVLLDRWMPDWKSRAGEPGVWIEDLLSMALAE